KKPRAAICLIGGEGVGMVTKPGLPVDIGEPAVNPVPRRMLCRNIAEELLRMDCRKNMGACHMRSISWQPPCKPHVVMPLDGLPEELDSLLIEVEVHVPKGRRLAVRTLNPRLGIVGGISILGTTGLVKPFSHEAYEETIQSALSVAASNGCQHVVLSTGGKSERFAQGYLPDQHPEAFIQIADFYAFSLSEAKKMGFAGVVHSVFFGKLVKMALGHPYTHAHKTSLDLNIVARTAEEKGCGRVFRRKLETANTARHALELLLAKKALNVVRSLAERALESSRKITGKEMSVRILLFDYDGSLLVDIR
ncbi:MAG: cobalt-precorrin-5B (C(1))-methyltransferase CbiD, partial [Desulforhabdus sp.]|nr:cobalt-precorrin-5B (C(1))-methyltransferase CbiD [Desulforhabdus sp.]